MSGRMGTVINRWSFVLIMLKEVMHRCQCGTFSEPQTGFRDDRRFSLPRRISDFWFPGIYFTFSKKMDRLQKFPVPLQKVCWIRHDVLPPSKYGVTVACLLNDFDTRYRCGAEVFPSCQFPTAPTRLEVS